MVVVMVVQVEALVQIIIYRVVLLLLDKAMLVVQLAVITQITTLLVAEEAQVLLEAMLQTIQLVVLVVQVLHQVLLVLHQLRDEGGLAAGRGAEVEHLVAGPRVEFPHRQERAGILEVKESLQKTRQAGERRVGLEFENQVLAGPVPLEEEAVHALVAPLRQELAGVGLERV